MKKPSKIYNFEKDFENFRSINAQLREIWSRGKNGSAYKMNTTIRQHMEYVSNKYNAEVKALSVEEQYWFYKALYAMMKHGSDYLLARNTPQDLITVPFGGEEITLTLGEWRTNYLQDNLDKVERRIKDLEANNPEYMIQNKQQQETPSAEKPTDEGRDEPLPLEQTKEKAEQQKEMRVKQLSQFTQYLDQLRTKRKKFHHQYSGVFARTENPDNIYAALDSLVCSLERYVEAYTNGSIELEQFKTNTSQAIRDKRNGVISQHRGCKEILANLLFAIGTLGIGYAIAALWTQSFTPIKVNTDSANKLDDTLDAINRLHP